MSGAVYALITVAVITVAALGLRWLDGYWRRHP